MPPSDPPAERYRDILDILNHRLRTPLRAVQNTLSLLADGSFDPLTEKQQEIVRLLWENSRELDRLIVMLLALYQYRNGEKQLKLEKGDLVQIVRHSLNGFAASASANHIELELELPEKLPVECDFLEVRTLIGHLIDNAIKYGRKRIIVEARADADQVHVEVIDDGPGIAAADIEKLFHHCQYLSSEGKYAPSTGVGLCLCSEIARAHGGTITCLSKPGEGARFSVSLPLHG